MILVCFVVIVLQLWSDLCDLLTKNLWGSFTGNWGNCINCTLYQCTTLHSQQKCAHSSKIYQVTEVRSMTRSIHLPIFVVTGWVVLTLSWGRDQILPLWCQQHLGSRSPTSQPNIFPQTYVNHVKIEGHSFNTFLWSMETASITVVGAMEMAVEPDQIWNTIGAHGYPGWLHKNLNITSKLGNDLSTCYKLNQDWSNLCLSHIQPQAP